MREKNGRRQYCFSLISNTKDFHLFIVRSLLLYKRQTNSFHHYDSCSGNNTSAARSLARNVEPFLHGKILA